MADQSIAPPPLLRVTALQPARRRAGFAFGREPVVLAREDLGTGLAAVMRLAELLGDPLLQVVLLVDEEAREIGDDERAALTALLEAEAEAEAEIEPLKVDPASPPTADAEAAKPAPRAPRTKT